MDDLLVPLAIVATVLVLAPLLAGVIDRAPLSFPIVFLGLGVIVAEVGAVDVGAHDPLLEVVATLTLTLVLFLDAMRCDCSLTAEAVSRSRRSCRLALARS